MKSGFMVLLLALVCACGLWTQSEVAASKAKERKVGIVLLAHGGRLQTWNEEVRHIADQVDLSIPTEVAFGMATRRTMQEAVDRLTGRGVTEIIAVPLFVSSHSSVITSTQYLLGLSKVAPEDLKVFARMDHSGSGGHAHNMDDMGTSGTTPLTSTVPIRMAPALDHHPIVSEILLDRATAISEHPKHEVVILVAHGPVPDAENREWLSDMSVLAERMKKRSHYQEIEYLTVRDDADAAVREAATQELRARVKAVSDDGRTALIVPLLLSYGGIENGMKERLKGLDYKMATQGLLPDQRIVDWVLDATKGDMASR